MDLENQTINLSGISNQENNVIPNITPLNATITGQSTVVNNPVDITTLGVATQSVTVDSGVINAKQIQVNEEAAAQVVVPTTTVSATTTNVNLGNVPVQQSSISQVQVTDSEVTRPVGTPIVPETNFVMSDTFTVNTELFKSMITKARKAAVCDPTLQLTLFYDITFDNECLKVISCNGNDVLEQVNKSVGFKDIIHFNVQADFFTDLISKLDCNTITFTFDSDTKYISITADDGSNFKVPEYYTNDEGKAASLEKPEGKIQQGDIVIDIDGVQFKQSVQSAGTMRCSEKVAKYLSGIYCSDRIYSTDSENMFGLPNLPQLINHPFYINKEFVDLILSLDFGTNARIVLRPNKENLSAIDYIIIEDSSLRVYGPCDLESAGKYPVPVIQQYMSSGLTSKFTIEKSKLDGVLKIAELFVEPNTDKECCVFTANATNGTIEVKSRNKQAHQYIPIQGLNKDLEPFNLKVRDFIKVLGNCSSDVITFEVDGEGYKNVRIIDNNCTLIMAIQNDL